MTPLDAVIELLGRVGALNGKSALVSEKELNHWPAEAVKAMKAQRLLSESSQPTVNSALK